VYSCIWRSALAVVVWSWVVSCVHCVKVTVRLRTVTFTHILVGREIRLLAGCRGIGFTSRFGQESNISSLAPTNSGFHFAVYPVGTAIAKTGGKTAGS